MVKMQESFAHSLKFTIESMYLDSFFPPYIFDFDGGRNEFFDVAPYGNDEESIRRFARKVVVNQLYADPSPFQIQKNTLQYAINTMSENDLYHFLGMTLREEPHNIRWFYWVVWDEIYDGEDYRLPTGYDVYQIHDVCEYSTEPKHIYAKDLYTVSHEIIAPEAEVPHFLPPENIDTLSNAAVLVTVQQISWEQAAGYAAARLSMLDAVPEDISDDDLSQQHNDYILLILYKMGAKRAIIYFERFIEALIAQLAWDAEKACDTFIFALNKAYWQRSEYNDFPNSLDSYLEMAVDAIHDEKLDVKNVVYLFSMKYVDGEYIIDDACV